MKNWRDLFPHADKVAHFLAGLFISFVIACVFNSPDFGFVIAFVAGLVKELYDQYHWKSGSWADWLATIIGGTLVLFIW
jgi:uncharacterized membrane protein YeaQ/YmgE (transglycosylase-associated protein family)